MTSEKPTSAIPAVTGPLRCMIVIRRASPMVIRGKSTDEDIAFGANLLTLPRVGDHLVFDPDSLECRITATVTDIYHEFLPYQGIEDGHRTFVVETITRDTDSLAKLSDNEALRRWLAEFDMLE